ncbi:MAG: glycosyltransferase [Verrucomicrobiota bacterium JB022]|nr:glycosyltransferase [Verrucomicrobiota bacterium JB022]
MNARVAIITRTRDRLPLLKRAIESLLGQSLREWQHVIVNDGGDAAALDAFLEPYRARYDGRLQVIHHEASKGMQPAANTGIRASQSEFLAIHDDDDAWHPDFLQDTVAFLDRKGADSRYQGVVVQTERVWEHVDPDGTASETRREPYLPLKEVNLFRVGYENPFPPIAFLYRRAVLENLGDYRPEFDVAGDLDFNLRFLLHYEIGVLPEVRAYYHWRENKSGEWANSVTAAQQHHALKLNEVKNHYLRAGRTPAEGALGLALEMAQYLVLQQWETRQIITRLDGFNGSEILKELHQKTEDLRYAIQHEDHGAVERAQSFLAKEIADKAEATLFHQSERLQKLEALLQEQSEAHQQQLLKELYAKAEDLRHVVRHEDHDALLRVRDFLAKEISDKAGDGYYRTEELLRAIAAEQQASLIQEFARKAEDLRHQILREDHDTVQRAVDTLRGDIADKAEASVYHQRVAIEQVVQEQRERLGALEQRLDNRRVILRLGPLEFSWQKKTRS